MENLIGSKEEEIGRLRNKVKDYELLRIEMQDVID